MSRSTRPSLFIPGRRSAVVAAAAFCAAPTWSQGRASPAPWPSRALRILVGFPGGSSPDLLARALAEPLSRRLGQPVIVENRPGASGNLAAGLVAHATDGHTIGVMINGNLTIARLLNPKLSFDPARDFAPLSLIATAPLVLVAAADASGASPKAFLETARQAGSRWNYGSPGVGTIAHIGMELIKARTGIAAVHVPYPGNPQVIGALLGGQIQLALLPPGLAMAQVKAGKLRAIAVTGAGRSTLAPEVPSLAEAGVPGVLLDIWNAAAAPVSMPAVHAQLLAELITSIARTPEMRATLFQQGWQVVATAPEGLAQRMKTDTAELGRIIASQGIRVE